MNIVTSNIAVLYFKIPCHYTIVNLISMICYVMYLDVVITEVNIEVLFTILELIIIRYLLLCRHHQ